MEVTRRGGGPGHDFNWRLGRLQAHEPPGRRRGRGVANVKPALRNSAILALSQTGLLVVGILAVAASNRLARSLGRPDVEDFLYFMNHGWLLLPLPIVWMSAAGGWLLRRNVSASRESLAYLSGALLLMALASALILEVAEPWRSTLPRVAASVELEDPSHP